MFKPKHSLIVLALMTAASVSAVPAYAGDEKAEAKPAHAEKAKPAKSACTAAELSAFIAAEKAEAKKHEAKRKKEKAKQHATSKSLKAPGIDVEAEHEKSAEEEAAHKAEKARRRAAEEKAYAAKKLAKACAAAKHDKAAHARKVADKLARARKFQAIGVVAVTDSGAKTVTVMVKAGSPDLHKRKLALTVTAETVIKLDGAPVQLADLVSGTFVSVHGVRHEGTLVAARINGASPGIEEDEVVPTSAPTSAAPVE